ncbi:MAG: Protein tyrosine phosphatase, partial [uncultured Sphingomonadaceae bacterium]
AHPRHPRPPRRRPALPRRHGASCRARRSPRRQQPPRRRGRGSADQRGDARRGRTRGAPLPLHPRHPRRLRPRPSRRHDGCLAGRDRPRARLLPLRHPLHPALGARAGARGRPARRPPGPGRRGGLRPVADPPLARCARRARGV